MGKGCSSHVVMRARVMRMIWREIMRSNVIQIFATHLSRFPFRSPQSGLYTSFYLVSSISSFVRGFGTAPPVLEGIFEDDTGCVPILLGTAEAPE